MKELAQEVYRLTRLDVRMMGSKEGGIVLTDEDKSSLVSKVKGTQDHDPFCLN